MQLELAPVGIGGLAKRLLVSRAGAVSVASVITGKDTATRRKFIGQLSVRTPVSQLVPGI